MSAKHLLAGALALGLSSPALSQNAPFGTDEDAAYAAQIWEALIAANLAGEGAILTYPYPGTDPHGMMLETFFSEATIEGHTGMLIVKRNYGPVGVSEDEVINDPAGHLGSVTVMFQREEGYSDETDNWFWVKYLPDGTLDVNPAGARLAGLVGLNAQAGCIACHRNAPGDDFSYLRDFTAME